MQKRIASGFPSPQWRKKKNMNTAIDLISHYWQQSDDCMLQIYDDIQTAFDGKANSNCNKQIISFCNA